MTDFDPEFDKLTDLPPTAPEVPHADLIARMRRASRAVYLATEAAVADDLSAMLLTGADALAALGDTVPREQHERHLAANRWPMAQLREARAERDALAHVIEQAPHDRGCDYYEWHRRPCTCFKSTAPAVSLALHDAEVWDEGAVAGLIGAAEKRAVLGDNPYRAAAIREDAK